MLSHYALTVSFSNPSVVVARCLLENSTTYVLTTWTMLEQTVGSWCYKDTWQIRDEKTHYLVTCNIWIHWKRITFTKLVIRSRKTRGCSNFQLCFISEVFLWLLAQLPFRLRLGKLTSVWPLWVIQELIQKTCNYSGQTKYKKNVKFQEVVPGLWFYLLDQKWDICKNKQEYGKYHCLAVVHTTRQIDVNRHTVHHTEEIYSYKQIEMT